LGQLGLSPTNLRITPGFAHVFRHYVANGTAEHLPPTSVRASAWLTADNRLQMTGWARPMVAPEKTDPTTLDEARAQLSADAQCAVEWFEQLGDTALLADGLRTGMDRSRIDAGPRVSR
jgi:hypothetical protein